MEVKVAYKFASVSPRKARMVVDLVRGERVEDALNTLRMTRQRASAMVNKLLRSAVATAAERYDADPEALVISKAWVDEGPTRKGWWARPRGMAARLLYRTSHINLVVSVPEELEDREAAKP